MRTNRGSTVYYWRDLYVLIVLQSVSLALKQFHRLLNDPNTRLLICHLFSFVNCLILLKSTVILMRVLLSCLYRINHQSINIIPLSKMFLPLRTFHFMVSFKKGLEALHVCSQLWNLFFFLVTTKGRSLAKIWQSAQSFFLMSEFLILTFNPSLPNYRDSGSKCTQECPWKTSVLRSFLE